MSTCVASSIALMEGCTLQARRSAWVGLGGGPFPWWSCPRAPPHVELGPSIRPCVLSHMSCRKRKALQLPCRSHPLGTGIDPLRWTLFGFSSKMQSERILLSVGLSLASLSLPQTGRPVSRRLRPSLQSLCTQEPGGRRFAGDFIRIH